VRVRLFLRKQRRRGFQSNRRLDRPQSRSGPFGEEINLLPLLAIEPRSLRLPACSMVTTVTELPRFPVCSLRVTHQQWHSDNGSTLCTVTASCYRRIQMEPKSELCKKAVCFSSRTNLTNKDGGNATREIKKLWQQQQAHNSTIYIFFLLVSYHMFRHCRHLQGDAASRA